MSAKKSSSPAEASEKTFRGLRTFNLVILSTIKKRLSQKWAAPFPSLFRR